MKKTVLLIGILFVFFGCKKEEVNEFPFDSFIFSYSGLRNDNSIKFTNTDTVYLQRRFPEPTENFYAILKANEKMKLNKFFKNLNLDKFDPDYIQENVADGGNLQFEIFKNKKSKLIAIYGGTAPEELYKYADFLIKFKSMIKFIPTKKNINFGDLAGSFDRPPPPPPIKQTE